MAGNKNNAESGNGGAVWNFSALVEGGAPEDEDDGGNCDDQSGGDGGEDDADQRDSGGEDDADQGGGDGGEDDADQGGGGGEDDAPKNEAEAKAMAAANARIGRIMSSRAAKGNVAAALALACNTVMSSRQIIAVLNVMPAAGGAKPGGRAAKTAGNPAAAAFAQAMAGHYRPLAKPNGAVQAAAEPQRLVSAKQILAGRAKGRGAGFKGA